MPIRTAMQNGISNLRLAIIAGLRPAVTACLRSATIAGLRPAVTASLRPATIAGLRPVVTTCLRPATNAGLRPPVTAVFPASLLISLLISLLASLLVVVPASPVSASPLTNIFLESIKNHGRASWAEGYQEGSVETLHDVVLRLNDGRRYDIATLVLDHDGNTLLIDATDVRMNPENDILLLRADRMSFRGHAGVLETFWTLEMITDTCTLSGPKSSLRVENPGLILAERGNSVSGTGNAASGTGNAVSGTGNAGSRNHEIRMKSLDLAIETTGNQEICTVDVDFSMQDYQFTRSDDSLSRANGIELSMQLPGSIASLAADPLQIVSIDLKAENVQEFIPGGATAWSIGEGTVLVRFEALGLVPGLTLILKKFNEQAPGFKPDDRMRLWNTLGDLHGALSVSVEHMTMRLANIVPPDYVTRFIDANLTTMLFDLTGGFEITDGKVMLVSNAEITGLADIDIETEFRPGIYSDQAISNAGLSSVPFYWVVPVYLDHLRYAQTDRGLISAAEDIMEIPVTVQINRIREERSAEFPEISTVIRRITTALANFLNLSLKTPPAVLELSVGEKLDLREALIVATELPQDIPDIFEFSVFRGVKDEK